MASSTLRVWAASGGRESLQKMLGVWASPGGRETSDVLRASLAGRCKEALRTSQPRPEGLPGTLCSVFLGWVSEGSLGGFLVRHHLALGLVSGADFLWKLMSGAGPGDLGGSCGSDSAENRRNAGPEISSQTAFRLPAWARRVACVRIPVF